MDQSEGVAHVETLNLTDVVRDSMTVAWTAPEGDPPYGYVILRTEGGASPTLDSVIVDNSESTDTTYTDGGLTQETQYTYWVLVLRSTGVSALRDAADASATTAMAAACNATDPCTVSDPSANTGAPVNLGVVAATVDSITVAWEAPATGEEVLGYKIERDGGVLVENTGNAATSYQDTGLADGTDHGYRVAAIRAGGLSPWSDALDARTLGYPDIPESEWRAALAELREIPDAPLVAYPESGAGAPHGCEGIDVREISYQDERRPLDSWNVTIEWDTPDCSASDGTLSGYDVWRRGHSDVVDDHSTPARGVPETPSARLSSSHPASTSSTRLPRVCPGPGAPTPCPPRRQPLWTRTLRTRSTSISSSRSSGRRQWRPGPSESTF